MAKRLNHAAIKKARAAIARTAMQVEGNYTATVKIADFKID